MDPITAAELEREIQTGEPITIVDVRRPEDFERWHIDSGSAELLNLPPDTPPDGWPAIAAGRKLRLICNRGNTSAEVVADLGRRGIPARSVSGGMLAWSRLLVSEPVEIGSPTTVFQFRREARGCLSYLIARDGRALVVDPAPDVGPYVELAGTLAAELTAVLDTHVHADHLSGARVLAAGAGVPLHMSQVATGRGYRPPPALAPVRGGDQVALGQARIAVLDLPGHTGDSIGLVIDGRALIAGDSLFADSIARPDLEHGDTGAADAAGRLHRTLHESILSLPGGTLLLPCHYPGGRMNAPVVTTIAAATAGIPALSLDRDAFVATVLADLPEQPANHEQIIAANLGLDPGGDPAALEVGANNCAIAPATAG